MLMVETTLFHRNSTFQSLCTDIVGRAPAAKRTVVCNGFGDGVCIAFPAMRRVVCMGVCVGADGGYRVSTAKSSSWSKLVGGYFGSAKERRANERIIGVIELMCIFVVAVGEMDRRGSPGFSLDKPVSEDEFWFRKIGKGER
jgi:hypothetical protein